MCAGLSLALYINPSIFPFDPSIYLILMHRTCTTIWFVLYYLYTYTITVPNIDSATNYVLCYHLNKTHVWTTVLLQLTLISEWMNNDMLSKMWDVINNHTRSFEIVWREFIWIYVNNSIEMILIPYLKHCVIWLDHLMITPLTDFILSRVIPCSSPSCIRSRNNQKC